MGTPRAKGGRARGVAGDLFLVLALVALLATGPRGPLTIVLAAGIPIVLGWGILTLHFPARVEMDGEAIAFFGYGRMHRFLWKNVERVRVRRFLVRDRVFVRIVPASPFQGRYWLVDSIEGYDAIVRALERASRGDGAHPPALAARPSEPQYGGGVPKA